MSMGMSRGTVLALSAIALAGPVASAAQTLKPAEIVIGVRDDAPPFVWTEPSTGNHLGFLWDICTKAAERAGFQFSTHTVSASERKSFLKTGAPAFDLLCDPTTITIGRMHDFRDDGPVPQLSFSPIVFVANGSYATPDLSEIDGSGKLPVGREKLDKPCSDRYASLVTNDPAKPPDTPPWIQLRPTRLELNKADKNHEKPVRPDRYEVWAFVEGSTIGERIAAQTDGGQEGLLVCPQQMASHRQAAQAFCEGRVARYFGDVDIVRASIADYARRSGASCPKPLFAPAGSYEPYAFVASSRGHPEFPERFSIALYEMYSDGTVDRLFAGHFPDMDKSQTLSTLFQINSVPKGDPKPPRGGGR